MAGPQPAAPGPGGQNGTIDVKPSDLFRVSSGVAAQQTPMDKGAKTLLEELNKYPDAGGYGTAPQAFATSYVKVGNRFLEVWAKSVASIGGAAVGFTTTANNYAKAEAANDPSGATRAVTQAPPQVIDKAPVYGPVPNLKWGDDDGGDDFLRSVLEWVPEPVREVLRPIVKHAFRMGKVAEVYPYPQQHYLNSLSKAWMAMTTTLSMSESALTGNVSSITQQSNSEWHDAMRQFCSSLWGTTAWGTSREGYEWKHDSASSRTASHPVMTVLFDTAQKVSDLLYEFAEAAVYVNGEVWDVYVEAIKDAIPKVEVNLKDGVGMDDLKGLVKGVVKGVAKGASQLGAGIVLNIDTAKLNAIVNEYNRRVNALVPRLDALIGPLDEAYRSAPSFHAEEARAQAFGARALNDFKTEHQYLVPGEDPKDHFYPLDLASQEGIHGSHGVDKHIGLTDDQLKQRLRDQGNAPSASSYKDLNSAQRLTQLALDDIGNADRVEKWIERVERRKANNPTWNPDNSSISPPLTLSVNEVTGRTVDRGAYASQGMNASASDVHSVQVALKYKEGIDPPFVVITSYPVSP
ncbi:RNase A-like domain-containing protein [Streptomyces sp.]|uniref:RNase A-like domain-containing protein n=1 Tax=Streptomyces sp. TaxID=1931 RepID=UPI002D28C64D|nr:RNase A-like domain-containing protein [Streptomyces sp.]HZF93130.1 RNase A-like domain-containing protein [Streptomyces sp.]